MKQLRAIIHYCYRCDKHYLYYADRDVYIKSLKWYDDIQSPSLLCENCIVK